MPDKQFVQRRHHHTQIARVQDQFVHYISTFLQKLLVAKKAKKLKKTLFKALLVT